MAGTAAAPENDFAEVYGANVKSVTAFFARRSTEPQTVADLTSETFVQAIASARHFDARRGSPRAWLLGIARVVYARHCAGLANGHELAERLAGQVQLADDELSELAERIDAQQLGRDLLARWQRLPEIERTAIELVDLADLSPREAAQTLGVPAGALRVRLFRARARLRSQLDNDERRT